MAYLRELTPKICRKCEKKAVVELVDSHNESRGFFCRKHGAVELKERNEWEKKEFNGR